ncbi:hypothetical protein CEW46_32270, partial [Bacillus cereus]
EGSTEFSVEEFSNRYVIELLQSSGFILNEQQGNQQGWIHEGDRYSMVMNTDDKGVPQFCRFKDNVSWINDGCPASQLEQALEKLGVLNTTPDRNEVGGII